MPNRERRPKGIHVCTAGLCVLQYLPRQAGRHVVGPGMLTGRHQVCGSNPATGPREGPPTPCPAVEVPVSTGSGNARFILFAAARASKSRASCWVKCATLTPCMVDLAGPAQGRERREWRRKTGDLTPPPSRRHCLSPPGIVASHEQAEPPRRHRTWPAPGQDFEAITREIVEQEQTCRVSKLDVFLLYIGLGEIVCSFDVTSCTLRGADSEAEPGGVSGGRTNPQAPPETPFFLFQIR